MAKEIWRYKDYKLFINDKIEHTQAFSKSALAKYCNCQSAYISQVLRGNAQLSLEQAYKASEYLGLSAIEQDFFITLIQWNRAGTVELQNYFRTKIRELKQSQLNLSKRIQSSNKLSNDEQSYYLANWVNTVIHLMTTIPKYKNEQDIANALSLPIAKVKDSIDFLVKTKLITQKKNGYQAGTTFNHIPSDSHLVPLLHSNNRQLMLDTINRLKKQDFANNIIYSSVISLSEDDFNQIKDILITAINKAKSQIKSSKEEVLGVFNIDFVKLTNK